MSKYRIVEVVDGNGNRWYCPQYRALLIWWNFEGHLTGIVKYSNLCNAESHIAKQQESDHSKTKVVKRYY